MKAYFKVWLMVLALALGALLNILGLISTVSGLRRITSVLAQAPQVEPMTDAYGNVVRNGERRFNYLVEKQGGFTRVELDEQGQIVSRQSLLESPFETIMVPPTEAAISSLTSQIGGSDPSLLELEWKYGLYGSGIGLSRISVFDIDGDSTLEMIMGGSSGGGFGPDDFWYVVKRIGPDTYDQVWVSDLYSASINRIAVADVDVSGIGEIYVGLSNRNVHVYDGLTLEEISSFTADGTIRALAVADVDGDSSQEIVTSDGSRIYVYSALSFTLEWASTAYGGGDLAVGNVDADPAPEIVTTTNGGHGYVLDGASHVLEWDYIDSFGNIVELGDIDNDGMAEIVGAATWYKITVFDADIRTPKWQIPAGLDIGALHVADTDGDGVTEILFGDGQWGSIHCYDGVTQTQRWSIGNPKHGVTDIALGDVNNDGVLEVLWGAGATDTGTDHLFIADTATRLIEWRNIHLDGPLSAVDVGDVDDDGQDEIVMVSFKSGSGYNDGIIHIFDATTHALEWRSTDLPDISAWTGVKSVKIGDVDDDGDTEFVIATADLYDGLIQIYNGQTHTPERQSAQYYGASFTALAIDDVDNDSQTEIVVGQDREHTGATGVYLIVFDGATATEEWKSIGLGTYWGYVYDIELSDVDDDGHIEIIASLAGERIYVYDGVTHQLDWLAAISAYALDAFDVDTDGEEEILVGRNGGVVEVYDGSTFTIETSFNLGTGAITGLLVDDINQDGSYEWLVAESTNLSIFNGTTKELMWQRTSMGRSVGYFNHINSRDIDNDGNKEIVLGTSLALYQFDVAAEALEVSTTYFPIILNNYCPPVYADDFSDPGSGWPINDTGNTLYEYLNGEYRVLVGNTDWSAGARPDFKASNYIVAVDVRNATGVYGSYGIIFGLSEDWNQFYTFEIYPPGDYAIFRYSSNTWILLTSGYSTSINIGTATNRLKVERNGSLIRAYANGQLLRSISDGSYTGSRHVGLIASSYNQPNVDARFDNFAVYPLACGAAATALGEGDETPDLDGEATGVGLPGHWESGQNCRSK
jgi:hypothetical protein